MEIILLSIITSGIVSFLMMKLQMKMIEIWMNRFFEEESRRIKKLLR